MKTLLFLLVVIAIGVIGFILGRNSHRFDLFGFVLCFISIFILVVALICLPILRFDYKAQAIAYKDFVETIENARLEDENDIERASVTVKIAEWNSWLAEVKYINETILDWYVPDKIIELEPIR